MGARSRDYCREFFKNLGILTLMDQDIHSITVFTVKNRVLHGKFYIV